MLDNLLCTNRNLHSVTAAAKILALLTEGRVYLSASTISGIGRGRVPLTSDLVVGFAIALGIAAGDLAAITGVEPGEPSRPTMNRRRSRGTAMELPAPDGGSGRPCEGRSVRGSTMDVYMEATLDPLGAAGRGAAVVDWFERAFSGPFADLIFQEERSEYGVHIGTSIRQPESSRRIHITHLGRNRARLKKELEASPDWAVTEFYGEDILGRVDCSYFPVEGGWSKFVVTLQAGSLRLADPDYCMDLVGFLAQALDDLNPAFARIERNIFSDWTNIESALLRNLDDSLPEDREFLRGYAWVTVCPQELVMRLGGADGLRASGAFHRVLPLQQGGVLLQASETLDGYTDQVMERVFAALAPVLPAGEPHPDPAQPNLRFVPRDAATVR